jgi:hypothetical protein
MGEGDGGDEYERDGEGGFGGWEYKNENSLIRWTEERESRSEERVKKRWWWWW